MNRFTTRKKERPVLRQILLPVLLFCAFLGLFWFGLQSLSASSAEEQLTAAQRAVTRAAVQCYATEGFYPGSIDYLKEKYGLTIDEKKFKIDYQCFASNIMPDITVVPIS